MKRIALLLLWVLALPVGAVEVIKSPNDDRSYRYLSLENGLRVLLVSDPAADKAAAALTVGVGSNSNPPDRPGLAHFLEHMLFMGTKKYPAVDDYSEFIRRHGGSDNAFTAGNQTTYFFDIQPDALEPALDRFAWFFIAPLMDARYVEREKHAVESEYRLKIKDDERRIAAAKKQGFNPASPWSRFAVGNLETLADRPGRPVREDLLAFYRRHYSAGIMGLAVVGREPLDRLEQWVREKFSAVPDRGARRFRPTPEQRIYGPDRLPLQVSAVPLKKLHRLELNFPLPSAKRWYRERPLFYLAHFIGDEGPGSLHAVLRKKGWLTTLTASGQNLDDEEALFTVQMELTEAGMDHLPEILQAFFAYLERMRESGVAEWRFRELQRKKALDFRFREKGEPADYAVELSARLLDYPPAEVLTAGTLLERYDPDLIHGYLERLRPDNMAVTLVAPDLPADRVERWYGVRYALGRPIEVASAPADWLAELSLPPPNPFLPENVELKRVADPSPVPRPLTETAGATLWFQNDTEFGVPRGAFAASLELPLATADARGAAALELLLRLVEDRLNEYAYPARTAGLGYSLERTGKGLLLMVYGYDDKQPVLLDRLLDALTEARFDSERFRVLKDELARDLANKALDRPFRQVLEALDHALMTPSWSWRERLAALEGIDREALEAFARHLFDRAELKVLAHGNFTAEEARAMERRLRRRLLAHARLEPVPDPRVKRLEPGRSERLRVQVDHPDAVVAVYYQGQDRSLEEKARWRMLAQVLRSPFYTELRTEQQLGYVVAVVPWEKERLPGLLFLVQSSAEPAQEVERRIDAFVADVAARLEAMDDDTFATHRAGLSARLKEKDRNLLDRTLRYLDNLERERYGFDYRRKLAEAVEQVEREALIAFARDRLGPQARRMVAWSRGTRFANRSSDQAAP